MTGKRTLPPAKEAAACIKSAALSDGAAMDYLEEFAAELELDLDVLVADVLDEMDSAPDLYQMLAAVAASPVVTAVA